MTLDRTRDVSSKNTFYYEILSDEFSILLQIRTEAKIENETREIEGINRTVRDHQNDMLKLNQVSMVKSKSMVKIVKILTALSVIMKMTC